MVSYSVHVYLYEVSKDSSQVQGEIAITREILRSGLEVKKLQIN